MRSLGLKASKDGQGGFTLLEALVGLLLAAVASGTIADTIVGTLKRSYITIDVTRASDESERFAAASEALSQELLSVGSDSRLSPISLQRRAESSGGAVSPEMTKRGGWIAGMELAAVYSEWPRL